MDEEEGEGEGWVRREVGKLGRRGYARLLLKLFEVLH